jgi:glycosyltransferase involved in cell wall biosynthesis
MAGDEHGKRVLVDALAARFGGGAYAAIRIARHLAIREDIAEVVVLARPGSIVRGGLEGAPGVRCLQMRGGERLELARRVAWQAARLPALIRRERIDALISMSGMLPRAPGCRLISMLGNPVMYERRSPGTLMRRRVVRRTAHWDAVLVAPSRLMADLVTESAGWGCAVLPWGVDHDVFRPAGAPGEEILCVADFYAHKRHDLLLAAWGRLRAPRPRLRLIGDPAVDPRAHARVVSLAGALPEAGRIVLEHGLPLRELAAAYRRARVFAMPSEHESFCMPLAECMACGVPAVARDMPSLRETGGEGASYVLGDDASRWADALASLLDDDERHARARERAVENAARFTWDAVAAALAALVMP